MNARNILVLAMLMVMGLLWSHSALQSNAEVSGGDYNQSLPLTLRAPLPTNTPLPTYTPTVTPTPPATPVPPPAGSYGLLTRGESLYRVDGDGTNLTLLANHPGATITDAEWSSDGTAFFYTTYTTGGERHVYLYQRNGTLLQSGRFSGFGPRWSPDGRWLIYEGQFSGNALVQIDVHDNRRSERSYRGDVSYFAISAGSQRFAATVDDLRTVEISIEPIIRDGTVQVIADKYVKAWLANDSRLLVIRHNGETEETGTWHSIPIGAGNVVDIGHYTDTAALTPSSDQQRLAYGRDNTLYVIPADSTTPLHAIIGGVAETFNAIRWSPDDQHLLYESELTIGGNPVTALSFARLDYPNPGPQRIGTALLNGAWRDTTTISYSQLRPTSNGYACDPILYDVTTHTTRPLLPPSDTCWQVLDWVTVP